MKPIKIQVVNGEGREKNPTDYDLLRDTRYHGIYYQFENSVKVYPAPGIPDGEHLCVLQWQWKHKMINIWSGLLPNAVEAYKKQFPNQEYRQIWTLASPKMNNQNNKGMETVEETEFEAKYKAVNRLYPINENPTTADQFKANELPKAERNAFYMGWIERGKFGAQWAKQQSDPEIKQLHYDNEACERRIVELEMLLKQQSDGDRWVSKEGWNKADENGNVDVPDHLDPLVNYVGTQIRFHTISGKNEAQTVVDIVHKAERFFANLLQNNTPNGNQT